MLYTYKECLSKFSNAYNLKQAVEKQRLFKIENGLYSDTKYEPFLSIIVKKYPKAVFTLNSAFFYHSLTDTVPDYYYLCTDKDSTKIANSECKQIYDNTHNLELGLQNMDYCGTNIRIYSKERLLIDLIRYKSKVSFDYYKEIITSYRRIVDELDFQLIEEYAEKLPKTKLVLNTIMNEVI